LREDALDGDYRLLESDLIDDHLSDSIWENISSGTAWQGELTSRTKAGEPYHELTTITPITDDSGAITHYVAIKQDLSDKLQHEEELSRHNAELRATEEELRQSNEELQVVQDELREYIETLVFANDELRLSENRFRNLVEAQSSYVMRTDLEGNYTYVNRRFADDFAHPQEKLIGSYSMDSIIPEDRPKVTAAMESLLQNPDTPLQVEIRKPRSNGSIVSTLWSFSCITNSDSEPVEIQCVGFDISERAALEQALKNKLSEKETLLKEVHHRIKNSIASIAQMLQLQAGYVTGNEAKDALDETARRIESLKSVYDMLLRSEQYEELSSRAYILSLLESIQQFYDADRLIEVSAQIDDFRIGARIAFLIGIIVNELLTNAFKYAFASERVSNEPNRIRITLSRDTSDKDNLQLVVRDNGVGAATAPLADSSRGLGSLLVHSLAEQQGGSAVMESGDGTTWTVTFRV
jgi:PAS domain S-box-containing protein